MGTLGWRTRDASYGGKARHDSSFEDLIHSIEEDVTDAPDLRKARDYLALLNGMDAALGHVELSFTAGTRPNFSVLHAWFNAERAVAKQAVKDLEDAGPAASPVPGPAPSPGAAPASPGPATDFGVIFEDMLAELEKEEREPGDLRDALEQVTLIKGLEATLDRLARTGGGPRGDMRELRTGLAGMRVEMEAEAGRLAPAGGGGSGGLDPSQVAELERLQQAVDDAEAGLDEAKKEYVPHKDKGKSNKDKNRAIARWKAAIKELEEARKALEDYRSANGLPAGPPASPIQPAPTP